MEQCPPWEANRFATNQEIPRILWNPKVHYRIHTWPPTFLILSQLDPVHTPTSLFQKIHLNIILTTTPGLVSFPQVSPPKPCIRLFSLPLCYMPRPSHSSQFYHPKNIGCGYRSLSSSLCGFLHSPVTSFLLGPIILLSTLLSNTLNCLMYTLNKTLVVVLNRAGRFREGRHCKYRPTKCTFSKLIF